MVFPVPNPVDIQGILGCPDEPVHLATGGFKAVYRFVGADGSLEALKAVFIPPTTDGRDQSLREQIVARTRREIQVLSVCKSPYLVRLGSFAVSLQVIAGHEYLLYSEELLPGASLVAWSPPSPEALYELFHCLVQVIAELARHGFVHRDIKPGNVMATGIEDRPFVVLDLGIAFNFQGTSLTHGGRGPGTPVYMAPELLLPDYKHTIDF